MFIFTYYASSMNFYCLMINNALKRTIYQISSERANTFQSKYFCIKFTLYVQNVHNNNMHSDVCERSTISNLEIIE